MYFVTGMYNEGHSVYHLKDIYKEAETYAQENNQFDVLPHRDTADFLPPPIFDIEFRIVIIFFAKDLPDSNKKD